MTADFVDGTKKADETKPGILPVWWYISNPGEHFPMTGSFFGPKSPLFMLATERGPGNSVLYKPKQYASFSALIPTQI